MSFQSIGTNRNIRWRTGDDEEKRKRGTLAQPGRGAGAGRPVGRSTAEKREIKADDFEQDAKDSARTGYDTENQLSSNLITVTLAFVALISVAISSSTILNTLHNYQKWTILIALIIFCLSILMGLINYFRNMKFHQRVAVINNKIADTIEDAHSAAEVKRLDRAAELAQPDSTARNSFFIILQIILMCAGLTLTVVFVGSILFD